MDANPSFSNCESKWLHFQNFSNLKTTVKTYKHFFNFSHEQMIFTSFTNWSVLTFWWIKYFDFRDFDTSHWFDDKNWKSRIYLKNFSKFLILNVWVVMKRGSDWLVVGPHSVGDLERPKKWMNEWFMDPCFGRVWSRQSLTGLSPTWQQLLSLSLSSNNMQDATMQN